MSPSLSCGPLDHRLFEVARAIDETMKASYREEAKLLGLVDFPPLRRTLAEIQKAESKFFGIQSHDGLEAVAEMLEVAEGKDISAFTVHPRSFRRGLGSRVLSYLLGIFGQEGLTVSTAAANLPALGLYQKHGFRLCREWRREGGLEMVALERPAAT